MIRKARARAFQITETSAMGLMNLLIQSSKERSKIYIWFSLHAAPKKEVKYKLLAAFPNS